jgi:hypothetical protein
VQVQVEGSQMVNVLASPWSLLKAVLHVVCCKDSTDPNVRSACMFFNKPLKLNLDWDNHVSSHSDCFLFRFCVWSFERGIEAGYKETSPCSSILLSVVFILIESDHVRRLKVEADFFPQ